MAKKARPRPVKNIPVVATSKKTVVAPSKPTDWYGWLAAGGLGLLVLLVFWAATVNNFVDWDDPTYVYQHDLILNPTAGSFSTLARRIVSLNFHPLTMWSLWLNARWSGGDQAAAFIATNIVLHAVNTLLVFFLALRLSGQRKTVAFITALLFAIHPLRVESVAWVSERKDVLYGLFFLAACLTYLKQKASGGRSWFVLTLLFFLLACLSKAVAVVFPVVLLLLDYWQGRPVLTRSNIVEKMPFFAIAILFGLIALNVQGGGDFHGWLTLPPVKANALGGATLSLSERLGYGCYGYLMYWVQSFWPNLSPFYPYPFAMGEARGGWQYMVSPLVVLTLFAGAWWLGRQQRIWWFGKAFFLVNIALVLQFVSVGQVMMADRYTYLPAVGLWFMLAYGVEVVLLRERPNWVKGWWAVAALMAVFFIVQTRQYIGVWRDTETLWKAVQVQYPKVAYPYQALGNWYGQQGRIEDAKNQLEMAVQHNSTNGVVFSGLANCYMILLSQQRDTVGRAARFTEIKSLYAKAIALEPGNSDNYFNRAVTLLEPEPQQALADLDACLQLQPNRAPVVQLHKGIAYLNLNKPEQALSELDQAIAAITAVPLNRQPKEMVVNLQLAYRNRAIARFNKGNPAGAKTDLEQAKKLVPNDPIADNLWRQMGF
jgi:protein O-mannosyl-transferase